MTSRLQRRLTSRLLSKHLRQRKYLWNTLVPCLRLERKDRGSIVPVWYRWKLEEIATPVGDGVSCRSVTTRIKGDTYKTSWIPPNGFPELRMSLPSSSNLSQNLPSIILTTPQADQLPHLTMKRVRTLIDNKHIRLIPPLIRRRRVLPLRVLPLHLLVQ